jgi:hypothetical protein
MICPQTAVTGGDFALLQQLFNMLKIPFFAANEEENIQKYISLHKCPFLTRIGTAVKTKGKKSTLWADTIGLQNRAFVYTSLISSLARMSYGKANLIILPCLRSYQWFDGKLPDIFLTCFAHCLKHFSRYVLEPKLSSEDWNTDTLAEAVRFFEEDMGLPVTKNVIRDGYYDSSPYFCDYVNLLKQSEILPFEQVNGECRISVNNLGECFRKHIGMFDFEYIHSSLLQSELLKGYDAKTHTLILDSEVMNKNAMRLEKLYGPNIRR